MNMMDQNAKRTIGTPSDPQVRDKLIEALKAGLAVAEHCNLNCTYHKRVMNEAMALLTSND